MRIESDITSLKMVNVIMSVYFIDLRIKTCELLVILADSVLVLITVNVSPFFSYLSFGSRHKKIGPM